jgi:hypothetical protein
MKKKKAAKEARKAVVCNQPGSTNPTMFYYTEQCILAKNSTTYKRTNRQATFSKSDAIRNMRRLQHILQKL